EVSLLKSLADLYVAEKEYFKALEAWRELVTNYPNTREAVESAQKMSDTFLALFVKGEADSMAALDALSLFYEFRDLTPPGEDGDVVIRNLADRLVSVDLLDRGAALLTHQIRFRLAGLEKARVGTRLALIHVLNRSPQLALDVLEFTKMDGLPAELETQRGMIAARALSELDKKEDALAMIEKDTSEEAEMLRVDIFWRLKDWPNVIRLIQRQLIGRELNPEPLNPMESELVTRLAVAYILDNYFEGLSVLRQNFGKLMKEGPQKDTFDFLTRETETIDPKNYEKVTADITKFEGYVTKLKERLKAKKLSDVVP
ncbi:MAG: hypothetical protein J0L97_01940, partial [Alphaproteobacteria bacterium]|nr:hypothetical protein [Alphaproteobacteria bacterium]